MNEDKVNKQKRTLEKEERLRKDLEGHRVTIFDASNDEGQVL